MPLTETLNDLEGFINDKANTDSPIFTGDAQVNTPLIGDKDKSVANTEFVKSSINLALEDTKVILSNDFVGGNGEPISLRPLYLSNKFSGDGLSVNTPLDINILPFKTILKSTNPGIVGEMCVDDIYLYRYIASKKWVRIKFSTTSW